MQSLDSQSVEVDSYPALENAVSVIAITSDNRVGVLDLSTMTWKAVDPSKVATAQQQLLSSGIQLPQTWN